MTRYIIRNGEKIFLNWVDEQMLDAQDNVITAINAIENICETVPELDEAKLNLIGRDIKRAYYSDTGDIEWNIINEHGIFELIEE